MIILKTNIGDIEIELESKKAPITSKNFISYVKDNFFNNTIFHRVIDNFMIQGGGFTEDMQQKTSKASIKNEAKNGLKNEKYSVSMARTADPDSATSQFFINVNDNNFLDYPGQDGYGYCVFAKVIKGMEIVDKIAKVETINLGGHSDVPADSIIIKKAYIKD